MASPPRFDGIAAAQFAGKPAGRSAGDRFLS
jgi:hypothetical protein